MKKSLIAIGLIFSITAFSANAQRHEGPPHQHPHSTAAIDLVISSVDDSNAAHLQTQLDTIDLLRASFRTLVDAEPQDQATIAVAHDAVKLAYDSLKLDVDALLANDAELKESVRSEMAQEREVRLLVAMALHIDENFALLISAATEEQAAQLIANQLTLDATRVSIHDAREAGSDHNEIHSIKEGVRNIFDNQQALASEVIAANDVLSAQLSESSESFEYGERRHKR